MLVQFYKRMFEYKLNYIQAVNELLILLLVHFIVQSSKMIVFILSTFFWRKTGTVQWYCRNKETLFITELGKVSVLQLHKIQVSEIILLKSNYQCLNTRRKKIIETSEGN